MRIGIIIISLLLLSCGVKDQKDLNGKVAIEGTWQLISGTVIANGDTTVTEYKNNLSFIKIINNTHFAFLKHDLGKDSIAFFGAGGGPYSLKGNTYIEHLEYCSDREWEGNDFEFTVNIKNDTLIQRGIEKIESAGIDQMNIEKYIRLK